MAQPLHINARIGEHWHPKEGLWVGVCVCARAQSTGRGDRLGTVWFWPVWLWPGSVTNRDSGVAAAVGSSTLAQMLPNSKVLLSNKIPAESQTEIRKECNGKIPKSRLHLRALAGRAAGSGGWRWQGCAPEPAGPRKRPPKLLGKDLGD